jgi:hypothetical protein
MGRYFWASFDDRKNPFKKNRIVSCQASSIAKYVTNSNTLDSKINKSVNAKPTSF